MSKELMYIRFVQIVIAINTVVGIYGVMQAKKGNIALHKKINGTIVVVTLAGVLGLILTVLLGWQYQSITTPLRMTIHRSFSMPLFLSLILAAYFGLKGNRKMHLRFVYITIPLWMGTLITGILFFL